MQAARTWSACWTNDNIWLVWDAAAKTLVAAVEERGLGWAKAGKTAKMDKMRRLIMGRFMIGWGGG